MTPTQRSLKYLRDRGYRPWITEHWNHFAKKRQDLWSFVDILCLKGEEILAVQTTSYTNMSARVKKIQTNEWFPFVKAANIKVVVHGWKKKGRSYELVEKEL